MSAIADRHSAENHLDDDRRRALLVANPRHEDSLDGLEDSVFGPMLDRRDLHHTAPDHLGLVPRVDAEIIEPTPGRSAWTQAIPQPGAGVPRRRPEPPVTDLVDPDDRSASGLTAAALKLGVFLLAVATVLGFACLVAFEILIRLV